MSPCIDSCICIYAYMYVFVYETICTCTFIFRFTCEYMYTYTHTYCIGLHWPAMNCMASFWYALCAILLVLQYYIASIVLYNFCRMLKLQSTNINQPATLAPQRLNPPASPAEPFAWDPEWLGGPGYYYYYYRYYDYCCSSYK